MLYKKSQSGYSLVEVLVSISILLIATVGPMSIATQGIKSSQFALEQNTAYFLAQEGIEVMFAIRNNLALEDINNDLSSGSNTSWDWVIKNNGLFNGGGPCNGDSRVYRLNSDGDSCSIGVHFADTSGNSGHYAKGPVTFLNCNATQSRCDIYLDEGSDRAVYSHDSGGDETPFRRIITITRETDYSIKVESKVTWDSNVFSTKQSVSETTYLFDSNFES